MIGPVVAVTTGAALTALFAIAVRYQFSDPEQGVRPHVPFRLVGTFRLFSPNPVRTDVHLVVCDYDAGGVERPAREVRIARLRRPRDAVWNPGKRRFLPLRSVMRRLLRIAAGLGDDDRLGLLVSLPYLTLLGLVMAEPAPPGVVARQFLLVERFGTDPEEDAAVVFCSARHRIDGSS